MTKKALNVSNYVLDDRSVYPARRRTGLGHRLGRLTQITAAATVLGTLGLSSAALAGGECPDEGECSFKKPNFLIVLDYSSSMSQEFAGSGKTRWEAAEEAVEHVVTMDDGFFDENMHLAVLRYAHDQSLTPTACPVDKTTVDVDWYDRMGPDQSYYECNGEALTSFVAATSAPPANECGTWTRNALEEAQRFIAESRTDHPDDVVMGEERYYGVLLMTDGQWTGPSGSGSNAADNPTSVAESLFVSDSVPTYVVAFGEDPADLDFAHEIAAAGGTNEALLADDPANLVEAMDKVVQDIKDDIIVPECDGKLPRIMLLLDASSSMLNVDDGAGGSTAGGKGLTGWDIARDAIAGDTDSLFDIPVKIGEHEAALEDLVHIGLSVFGAEAAVEPEHRLLVQYGPCMKDNVDWALNPETSCDAPGCDDPWGGPTIDWTFKDSNVDRMPPFVNQTQSHMPQCQAAIGSACSGSGTMVHLGLNLVAQNVMDFKADPDPYPLDTDTAFINILLTDGNYNSADPEVEAPLKAMFADGITTFVIGMGAGVAEDNLNKMADWGSGGMHAGIRVEDKKDLQDALANIVSTLDLDPCCALNDCSEDPEPDLPDGDSDGDESTGDDSTGDETTGDETTGDETTGDETAEDTTADDTTGDETTAGETDTEDTTTSGDDGADTTEATSGDDGGSDTTTGESTDSGDSTDTVDTIDTGVESTTSGDDGGDDGADDTSSESSSTSESSSEDTNSDDGGVTGGGEGESSEAGGDSQSGGAEDATAESDDSSDPGDEGGSEETSTEGADEEDGCRAAGSGSSNYALWSGLLLGLFGLRRRPSTDV